MLSRAASFGHDDSAGIADAQTAARRPQVFMA
jgi:hypothetical protein